MHPLMDFTTRPMTADEVLVLLRHQHRQCAQEGGNPDAIIHPEMTVADWCEAADWIDGPEMGKGLNDYFGIEFTGEEWRGVLEPSRKRTLRGVCDLVASKARVDEVREVSLFGRPCVSAAVFLAVRTYLSRAGADVRHLKPSTPLAGYLGESCYSVFYRDLPKIAPSRVPSLDFERSRIEAWLLCLFLGCFFLVLALASVATCTGNVAFGFAILPLYVLGSAALFGFLTFTRRPPKRTRLGSLYNFGDLVRTMLGEPILTTPDTSPHAL